MLDTVIPRKMRGMDKSGQGGPDANANTDEILEAFLLAARETWKGADADGLRALEDRIPWYRRPFFWEGHGFGVAALQAFSRWREPLAHRYVAPGFRFMLYTGVGVWNGAAGEFHVPKVSLDPARWEGVEDFLGCQPLLSGGISFSVVTTRARLLAKDLERYGDGENGWWRRGLYQGGGRASWFLYMRNPARAAAALDAVGGEEAQFVAEGLGLAMTYTQLSEPDWIVRSVDAMPDRYRAALLRGVRLCLGASNSDDPRISDVLDAMPAPLDRLLAEGRAAVAQAGRGADLGPRLLQALMAASEGDAPPKQAS